MPIAKSVRYFLQACVAYIIYAVFWFLPLDAASALGSWLMRTIGPHLKAHRVALQNVARVFPEKSELERAQILQGMWDNLGRVIAEYPHLHHIASRVEVVDFYHLDRFRQEGCAVIFFGAHLANWEVNGVAAKVKGFPIHAVYRKPNNPYVDWLLRCARGAGAQELVPKGAAGAKALLAIIKKKGFIGILADQRMDEGLLLPFFGVPAKMGEALAVFAMKYNVVLCPVRAVRLQGSHFKTIVYPPLEWVATGDKEADTRTILNAVNAYYEGWIKEYPAQWLWTHKRWPNELYK